MTRGKLKTAMLATAAFAMLCGPASASRLSLSAFNRETGISADAGAIQRTWQALEAMGTTKFLGGMMGGFKLDESSMVAGALSIGAGEFDALLNGRGLNVSGVGVGEELVERMNAASGIDISAYTGSFTDSGGGNLTSTAMASGAFSGSGACDTTVANGMAAAGKAHVDKIVTAAMSKEFGFSEIKGLSSSGGGTGFGALGCLDKLFQNAGSDIMFKPPSLGSLTSQIQNWVCNEAASVQEQVAGAFGEGEIFSTGEYGGFFPSRTYGEAVDGSPSPRPGIGQAPSVTFGESFAAFESTGEKLAERAALQRLFR